MDSQKPEVKAQSHLQELQKVICFLLCLTKHAQNLCAENYNTRMREIKEDLDEREGERKRETATARGHRPGPSAWESCPCWPGGRPARRGSPGARTGRLSEAWKHGGARSPERTVRSSGAGATSRHRPHSDPDARVRAHSPSRTQATRSRARLHPHERRRPSSDRSDEAV